MRAAFTLESSFIYPLVITLCVILIFYSFLIHDKIVIRSDMYRVLMENYYHNDEDFPEYDTVKRLKDKCMLNHSFKLEYEKKSDTLQLIDLSPSLFTTMSTSIAFTGYERCDFIRQYYTIIHYLNTNLRKD